MASRYFRWHRGYLSGHVIIIISPYVCDSNELRTNCCRAVDVSRGLILFESQRERSEVDENERANSFLSVVVKCKSKSREHTVKYAHKFWFDGIIWKKILANSMKMHCSGSNLLEGSQKRLM